MVKRFLSILLTSMVVLAPAAFGQQGATITGKVTDETGEPLVGANVIISELDAGSSTDIEGNYRFTIPAARVKGQEVEISARFIGYRESKETIVLQAGSIVKDFTLAEDVLNMEAIVVTGVIDETPREKLSFTVAQVGQEQLEQVPATNAVANLQGKVAGVRIVSGSGTPGTGLSVNLRASTSITKSSSPLFIVDGVILGSNQVDIDALDIQSIEVVKGAAASSLYGSRAQNGVIQITTNRGSSNALNQTRVRVRSEYGFNQLAKKVKLSQSHEFLVNENGDWVDADGNIVDRIDRVLDPDGFQDNQFKGPLYDNMELFFDPGDFNINLVSLTHNSQKTNFLASMGNVKESGVIAGLEGYRRQNVRVNLDHNLAKGLDISFSGYYSTSRRDDPDGDNPNPFFGLMFINPDADLLRPNADGQPYIIQPDPNTLEENPLYATHTADIKLFRQRFLGSFNARWAPTTNFNVEANFSYDRSDRNRKDYYKKGYLTIDNPTLSSGRIIRNNAVQNAINANIDISYNKQFGDLTSRTKARYLYESQKYDFFSVRGDKLKVQDVISLDNVEGDKFVSSTFTTLRAIGYYLTSQVDYKDRYIADFLIRRDGSSLFGPNQRWQNYYRFSAAYRLSEEDFWNFDAVNEFKLRYSIGTAGNRPGFYDQYETYSVSAGTVSKGRLGNADLRPELQTEQEYGLDFALYDRVSVELTYAKSNIEDLILYVPLAGYYGFSSQALNAASMETNTFEATVNASLYRTRDMNLSMAFVFDRTRQTITEFNRPAYRTGPGGAFYNRSNENFGAMYGRKWLTSKDELKEHLEGAWANFSDYFDVNDDGYLVPVGQGNSWRDGMWGTTVDIDTDGDGVADTSLPWGMPFYMLAKDENGMLSDFQRIGNTIPDFNFGISTTLRWKGFNAYILFDAQIGGDIYNQTRQWAYRELRHGDVDQAGKPQERKKTVDYYNTLYNTNSVNSAFVEDGTYLKLRELNLSYAVNKSTLVNLFGGYFGGIFNKATFGVIGRNLLTFTNYSGFDPEVGQGDATIRRFDGFGYPNFRTYTGYIEFEF